MVLAFRVLSVRFRSQLWPWASPMQMNRNAFSDEMLFFTQIVQGTVHYPLHAFAFAAFLPTPCLNVAAVWRNEDNLTAVFLFEHLDLLYFICNLYPLSSAWSFWPWGNEDDTAAAFSRIPESCSDIIWGEDDGRGRWRSGCARQHERHWHGPWADVRTSWRQTRFKGDRLNGYCHNKRVIHTNWWPANYRLPSRKLREIHLCVICS